MGLQPSKDSKEENVEDLDEEVQNFKNHIDKCIKFISNIPDKSVQPPVYKKFFASLEK